MVEFCLQILPVTRKVAVTPKERAGNGDAGREEKGKKVNFILSFYLKFHHYLPADYLTNTRLFTLFCLIFQMSRAEKRYISSKGMEINNALMGESSDRASE